MPEPQQAGFLTLTGDIRRMWSEVSEMLALRKQLAELEIRSDIAAAKRLAIVGAVGIALGLTGFSVLVVLLAGRLDALLGDGTFPWVTLITGASLLLIGPLTIWISWRRFNKEFHGLQESVAELKEDLVWLREWIQSESTTSDDELS